MSGLNVEQARTYIIRPALEHIGFWSAAAETLVLATGLAESGLRYVDQVDKAGHPGPAFGLFQIERATHDDIWRRWLAMRPAIADRVRELIAPEPQDLCRQMWGNHLYAAAMCRIFYLRVPERLPLADEPAGMARYWKRYYNTSLGKGTIEGFLQKAAPAFS